MDRITDLDALLDHVWTYVGDAGSNPQHPFRTPAFGTAGIDPPNLRTVVIRHVDPEARVVAFHSDRRAGKIGEIRANDRIAWHGWDPERSQQILLHGSASVHTDDSVADRLWEQASPQELKLYVRPKTPGTPLDEPGDGLADAVKNAEGELTREDVAPGRRYFAAVRTVIDEIFFLHLHRGGHYRARFRHGDDGWEGEWIVP